MSLFDTALKNITNRLFGEAQKKETIAHTLSECTGQTITADMVILRDGILFIQTNPTIKTLLKLRQEVLIEALNAKGVVIRAIG